MNDYRCSDVDDLLAGFAADALEEDERCAVATHLAECRNHDAELSAIRAGFERLAIAVTPVEPPPSLRTNLLAAFDRELAGPATTESAAPSPVRPMARPARPRLLSTAGLGYALAAALLVVAAGLGIWGLSRGGDKSDVLMATSAEAGQSLQLTYVKDEHLAVLTVDLEQPPADRAYQAWQIVDGAPVSVGVLDTHSGSVAFTADLEDASAIALTIEPLGGSLAPTTTPFLLTELPKS